MNHLNIAKQAVALVKPSIEELFKRTNRKELHIVIMDPRLKPWESSFSDAIYMKNQLKILLGKNPLMTLHEVKHNKLGGKVKQIL